MRARCLKVCRKIKSVTYGDSICVNMLKYDIYVESRIRVTWEGPERDCRIIALGCKEYIWHSIL